MIDVLSKEYEEQLEEMKSKYEEEKISKGKLEEDMNKLREYYDNKIHAVEGQFRHDLPKTSEGAFSINLFSVVINCCTCISITDNLIST